MVDKIIAEEILIGSKEGQHLRLAPDDIRLHGSPPKAQAGLTIKNTRPSLYFFDENAQERVHRLIEADGTPQLQLQDTNGAPRLW